MRRRAAVLGVVVLLCGSWRPALAQVLRLDPLPWYAAADTSVRSSATITVDRFWDDHTGWTVDRLGLMVVAPLGRNSVYFVRAHVMRFDTGALPVLSRWPAARGTEAGGDWPASSSPAGQSGPEIGLMAPLSLPLIGGATLGLAAGLPFGRNALYPFASSSIPLRLELRRSWRVASGLTLATVGGGEKTLDSGGDELTSAAFPGGWRWAVEAGWRTLTAGYEERALTGHAARRVRFSGWLPLGGGHAVGLVVARELGPRGDRTATNEVSVRWRFAGLPGVKSPDER